MRPPDPLSLTPLQEDLRVLTTTFRDIPKVYERALDEITRLRVVIHQRYKRGMKPCPCGCLEKT